jgi:hypothetical protein
MSLPCQTIMTLSRWAAVTCSYANKVTIYNCRSRGRSPPERTGWREGSAWRGRTSALMGQVAGSLPGHPASVSGSTISAVRTKLTTHPGPSGRVSACQVDLEPVSGFEPLTVRLQGGCSAKLSYTGRLVPALRARNPCQGTVSGAHRVTDCRRRAGVDAEHLGARPLACPLKKRPSSPRTRWESHVQERLHQFAPLIPIGFRTRDEGSAEESTCDAVRCASGPCGPSRWYRGRCARQSAASRAPYSAGALNRYTPVKGRPKTFSADFIDELLEVTGSGRARDFETAREDAIIRILRSEGIRRAELLEMTMHTLPADVIRNPIFRLVPLKGARAAGEGRLSLWPR